MTFIFYIWYLIKLEIGRIKVLISFKNLEKLKRDISMDLETFATDLTAEKEGARFEVQDGAFYVRASNYPLYRAAFDKELSRRRLSKELDTQGALLVATDINRTLVPKFLISGMENITLGGKVLEYPGDLSILSQPKYRNVTVMIYGFSDNAENYKPEENVGELLELKELSGKSKSA